MLDFYHNTSKQKGTKMIQVAIEDWGLYNSGVLVCKWWNMNNTIEEIREFYINLRKKHGIYPSDDLELFNADYEGTTLINECTPFEEVQELSEKLEALTDYDQKKIDYLMDYNGCPFEEALEQLEEVELYEDMTLLDLAYELVEEGCFGNIPDNALAQYIDYEAIARDLQYDYTVVNNDIFRSA